MRAWWLVVVFAGCGASVPIDDFVAAYQRADCEFRTRCGLWRSAEDCEASSSRAHLVVDDCLRVAVDTGRTDYDGAQAQRCVDDTAKQSCDSTMSDSLRISAECNAVFRGTADIGAACTLNTECVSGDCDAGCDEAGCGRCADTGNPMPVEAGDDCFGRFCDTGLTCDPHSQTCVSLGEAGAPCSVFNRDCGRGNGCIPATADAQDGQCGPLPDTHAACTPDGQCRNIGDHCISGVCTPYLVEGDACAADGDCSPSLRCIDGACASGVAEGGACTAVHYCGAPADFCSDAGTCIPLLANGAACGESADCASGYCSTTIDTPGVCSGEPGCS